MVPNHVEVAVQLGEVGRVRQPVVHLQVDVGGVLAVPRGIHFAAPDPLQIARLGPLPRRRDQNVSEDVN